MKKVATKSISRGTYKDKAVKSCDVHYSIFYGEDMYGTVVIESINGSYRNNRKFESVQRYRFEHLTKALSHCDIAYRSEKLQKLILDKVVKGYNDSLSISESLNIDFEACYYLPTHDIVKLNIIDMFTNKKTIRASRKWDDTNQMFIYRSIKLVDNTKP